MPKPHEITDATAPADAESLQSTPWGWWREKMPVTKKWAYLDHAAVGPLSAPAANALRLYAQQAETEGDICWPTWHGSVESLRKGFAQLLRADPDEVCLVPNTSTGINLVAEGFPWNPGDSVVIPDGEFPSNLFPWENQRSRGVEVRVAPRVEGRVDVEALFRHVDSSTKIIALSWVGYASGFRVDLEEIVTRAHAMGVLVFLDAIQGLGVFDLDLRQIDVDFLSADGHKWLLGPEGLGVAMIRKRHLDTLRCGNVGWNSVRNTFNYSDPKFELRPTAVRFEPGSANMPSAAALGASLDLFLRVREAHGVNAIGDRVLWLVNQLQEKLESIGCTTRLPHGGENRSGIVTFDVPGHDPANIRSHAIKQGCVVSCRDGGVRVGIHAYNNEEDIDRLVNAIGSA